MKILSTTNVTHNFSEIHHNSCPNCGGTSTRTGAGRKPQEASLHCSDCKRFIKWVSASELKALIKGGGQ